MTLEGKVAVVTGASRGIGRETALELARMGADIVANCSRESEDIKSLASEIEALGRKFTYVVANVAVMEEAKKLIDTAISEMGRVDILVNNLATDNVSAQVSSNATFFTNYRDDRQETRNQEMLYLDAIIASEATSQEARAAAQEEKLQLVKNMEVALNLESLIIAKGFEDVVVATASNSVSVMVETNGLTAGEVAQIVDVVVNNSSYNIDNIKIIEV